MNQGKTNLFSVDVASTHLPRQTGFLFALLIIFSYVYGAFGFGRTGQITLIGLVAVGLGVDFFLMRSSRLACVSRWALLCGLALILIWERFFGASSSFPARFGFLLLIPLVWVCLLRVPSGEADLRPSSFLMTALILGLTALVLAPMLRGAYYWDDAINATVYGAEKFNGLPLWRDILTFMHRYLELGRINVLSFYYYFYFYLPNPFLYKSLILLTILVNQWLFGKTVRTLTGSERAGHLAMMLVLLSFQMRPFQDPLNGFYSLMQVILTELLLMTLFLIRYLRDGNRRGLILSVTMFALGLLTYEVMFPFLLMVPVLVWFETRDVKKSVQLTLPFLLVWIAAIVGVAFVRSRFLVGDTYSGVAFSIDPLAILRTYVNQTMASLPMSFHVLRGSVPVMGRQEAIGRGLTFAPLGLLRALTMTDWALLILSAAFLLRLFSRLVPGEKPYHIGILFGLGASLWLLQGVTIALSERYQVQLIPGIGYLPVYLGYYGAAAILTALSLLFTRAVRLREMRYRWFVKAGVAVFTVLLAVLLEDNRKILSLLDAQYLAPRQPGQAALEAGIFDFLPDGSTVLTTNPDSYLWEADWNTGGLEAEFYTLYSGRDFLTGENRAGRFNAAAFLNGTIAPGEKTYLFAYDGDGVRGIAKLGRLVDVSPDSSRVLGVTLWVDTVLYYLDGNDSDLASVSYVATADSDPAGFVVSPPERQWQIRHPPGGVLAQLHPDQRIDFETLQLFGF